MIYEFNIPERFEEEIEEWQKNHVCKYRAEDGIRYTGAVGGADTFKFTPTSIGTFITVRCLCGEELKFSDV